MTTLLYIGLAILCLVYGLVAGYVLGHKFQEDEALKKKMDEAEKGK